MAIASFRLACAGCLKCMGVVLSRGWGLRVPATLVRCQCLFQGFVQDLQLAHGSCKHANAASSFLFLVAMPGAPSSVLAPSSKARSP